MKKVRFDASRVATTTLDSVTTTYGYDDIDQLTSESRSGYSATYTYDANGNRLTRTVGGVTEDYSYDDADKLQDVKVGGVTQKSYGYDSAGRTTSVVSGAGTTTLAYDYEGRISTITYPSTATNTFTYNGLDTRVGKVDSAGTSTYKRDGAGVTAPVLNDGAANYTPGISERRASTTTFLHSGLKNADSQTGTGQTIGATKQYDAFGNVLSSTGTWKGPFGYAGSFGYQEDADSSLKLLGHRYYDSSIGRFLTRDPIKDGRNWYAYCDSNPLNFIDRKGLSGEKASGVPKGIAFGLLGIPGYVDKHGNLVMGHVTVGPNGKPWVDERGFHLDYPHGKKTYKSAKPHINSDAIPLIDHAEVPPGILKYGNAKFIKGLGGLSAVAGVAYDAVSIANSDEPVKEGLKSLTVWGGTATGAAIGTGICPGIGTFVGGLAGGLITSVIVYWND